MTMDYDLISNYTSADFESSYDYWIIYPHEIVYAVISFFSLCAHGLVIFTILKNKSLRTPTYLFLLNILILDGLYVIASPANLMLPLHYIFVPDIYCVTYDIETTMQSGVILLLILLSFNYSVKRQTYLFFIIGTWTFTVLLCIIFIVLCAFDIWSFAAMLLTFFSFALLILIHIICRVAFWKKHDVCPFRLNIVSVYLGCWVLCWICLLFSTLAEVYNPALHMMSVIFAAVGYGYGVINLFALACFDTKFKTHLLQVVTCAKYDYADAGDNDASDVLTEDQDFATQDTQDESTLTMI